VPQGEVRVTLSAAGLRAEAVGAGSTAIRLSDSGAEGSVLATVRTQVTADSGILATVEGTFTRAGSVRPFGSTLRLSSGHAVRLATLGAGPRAVAIWLRATVDNEAQR
jgi:hypothetical protein